jgi:glycosyltransferase involved in cell wall biosynthesis
MTATILRVIDTTNPAIGGPIEGLLRSSAIMAEHGYANEVVTLDGPADPWLAEFPLPVHAMGPARGKYRYTPRFVPWLKQHAGRYRAVIVHGLWRYSSLGAWRALGGSAIPYVIFAHGSMDPWFHRGRPIKHLAKQAHWLALEGRVLSAANWVLFTSAEERRLARASFFGHCYRDRVVAYGSADVAGDADIQIAAFREKTPTLGHRAYLLFLGRIHPKKGCDLLLRAFAELAGQCPETDVVIAGPDVSGWSAQLKAVAESAGIADRVHWSGPLSGDAKWGAFRGAEAFVLPSHQENFGLVVAEAMACSTPVLITNKVNIWQEVETAGAGLVANDDLDGIRDLLVRFMSLNADAKRKMAVNSRTAYQANFDIAASARDLIRIVDEIGRS